MHSVTLMHRGKPSTTTWADYVRKHMGDQRQQNVAERSGISQTTISRWLSGKEPQPTALAVIAFARGVGQPPVEALVVAGVITPDEAEAVA